MRIRASAGQSQRIEYALKNKGCAVTDLPFLLLHDPNKLEVLINVQDISMVRTSNHGNLLLMLRGGQTFEVQPGETDEVKLFLYQRAFNPNGQPVRNSDTI
jgi:hypothetical protein